MEYFHEPVLLAEVLSHIRSTGCRTIVDCTLGGAGHAEAILDLISPEGFLLGIDKDDAAIEAAKVRLARFSQQTLFVEGNFADLDAILTEVGVVVVDGFLLDVGLASAQVDEPERGFSYQHDAYLDMRMDRRRPKTAADILATYSQEELTRVISQYGEERWAGRIAAFIVKARSRQPIERTAQLVTLIKQAIPASARRQGGHPAKRTFQALRIEVNGELRDLEKALADAPKWLSADGRIVVISYHSLEDRIVKDSFRAMAKGCVCPPELPACVCGREPILRIVTRRPTRPSDEEVEANPRARSARLRAAERV